MIAKLSINIMFICLLFGLAMLQPEVTADETSSSNGAVDMAADTVSVSEPTFSLKRTDAFQYEPEGRRDPFVSLFYIGMGSVKLEGIEGMRIDELILEGILYWGQRGHIALFRGTDNKVYQLHVGDKVFDGTIIDITADVVQFEQQVFTISGDEKPPRTIKRALRNS